MSKKPVKRKNKKEPDRTKWPVVAICYDFDKTLSPHNMQEFAFIPEHNLTKEEFWKENEKFSQDNKADQILSYMYMMMDKSHKIKPLYDNTITKNELMNYGKSIELFPGVTTWFNIIREYADELKINVEHYIISAGLEEIIMGSSIYKRFKKVYASSYIFDKKTKTAKWPSQVVNGTNKTQYIFRINKGCLDELDTKGLNKHVSEEDRRIPFSRMIYIGDSETDIPCMTLVKRNGGYSIGVYNPDDNTKGSSYELVKDNRINFFAKANYKKGEKLYKIVAMILRKILSEVDLKRAGNEQKRELETHYEAIELNKLLYMVKFINALEKKEKEILDALLNDNYSSSNEYIQKYKVIPTFPDKWFENIRNEYIDENKNLYNKALKILSDEKE